jgi:hypothetical protein
VADQDERLGTTMSSRGEEIINVIENEMTKHRVSFDHPRQEKFLLEEIIHHCTQMKNLIDDNDYGLFESDIPQKEKKAPL